MLSVFEILGTTIKINIFTTIMMLKLLKLEKVAAIRRNIS